MDSFLTLRPGNVGVDHDALMVEVKSAAQAGQCLHALLDLPHLTFGHALRQHGLRLDDPKHVASPLRQRHGRARMEEQLEPGQHTKRVLGVLGFFYRRLGVADIENRPHDCIRRNRVLQGGQRHLSGVD